MLVFLPIFFRSIQAQCHSRHSITNHWLTNERQSKCVYSVNSIYSVSNIYIVSIIYLCHFNSNESTQFWCGWLAPFEKIAKCDYALHTNLPVISVFFFFFVVVICCINRSVRLDKKERMQQRNWEPKLKAKAKAKDKAKAEAKIKATAKIHKFQALNYWLKILIVIFMYE